MVAPNSLRWASALLALLLFRAPVCRAEADTFGIGDGHSGAQTVASPNTVINHYAALQVPGIAGDLTLQVAATTGFGTGDLVLVFQATGTTSTLASGDQAPVDLSQDTVGRWELARLSGVSATTLSLRAPLLGSFPALFTQAIQVPEYTTLTVSPGASIVAMPWEGTQGGVLAFLATGDVAQDGLISAAGAGFRPGALSNEPDAIGGCFSLDEAEPRGAHKAEGIDPLRYSLPGSGVPGTTGYGNVGPAGGGGNCQNGGGGGGGNGGHGGQGGLDNVDLNPVGGLGGAPLRFDPIRRVVLGGGGGSGHENNDTGSGGGSGGGVVFIRAASLSGSGTISADGAGGPDCPSPGWDGAGGGGAGGTIYLRVVGVASCTLVSAQGGNGGSPLDIDGPGGGGGGGQILFQQSGAPASCPTSTLSGVSGLQPPIADPFGATPQVHNDPQFAGIEVTSLGGFVVPPPPVLTAPGEGEIFPSSDLISVEGTATADALVTISVNGVEAGQTQATPAGTWSWSFPAASALGLYRVAASAELLGVQSLPSAPRTFTLAAIELLPRALRVAWACQAVDGTVSITAWVSLLFLVQTRRRR